MVKRDATLTDAQRLDRVARMHRAEVAAYRRGAGLLALQARLVGERAARTAAIRARLALLAAGVREVEQPPAVQEPLDGWPS